MFDRVAADTRGVGRRALFLVGLEGSLFVGALVTAFALSSAADWSPLWLFFVLLVLAVISDALALRVGKIRVSGSFSALVLAMILLGPAPAVLLGVFSSGIDSIRSRHNRSLLMLNLATYATFPLVGAIAVKELGPGFADVGPHAGLVLAVFVATNFLNFALIFGHFHVSEQRTWGDGLRNVYFPVLPVEIGTGVLTAGVVVIEQLVGAGAVAVLSVVVLAFQYMLRTALNAVERGHELEARNQQLASLQVGLISTMVKTLSLRDHMTARHSAAVARYSREMAAAMGLSEVEQELIHTAGLFHDIGKFIFPDSILVSGKKLTDEEYEIVKQHPEIGAELIGEIDGYGPVADIVRWHHERIDGRGYPDGIVGDAIPVGSRIIAVADVYDVITARDTYRKPVSMDDAFAELRRSAGTQLDAEIVEVFIGLVLSKGLAFRHSTATDFEAELALQRRVFDYAAPKKAA
jgi:putative nucleotidyltransferase with HDIG domain